RVTDLEADRLVSSEVALRELGVGASLFVARADDVEDDVGPEISELRWAAVRPLDGVDREPLRPDRAEGERSLERNVNRRERIEVRVHRMQELRRRLDVEALAVFRCDERRLTVICVICTEAVLLLREGIEMAVRTE